MFIFIWLLNGHKSYSFFTPLDISSLVPSGNADSKIKFMITNDLTIDFTNLFDKTTNNRNPKAVIYVDC